MDYGMKSSADPEQCSSAANPSTKSLKGSTDSAPELANKKPTAVHHTSKDHYAHHKSAAVTSTAKPLQHPPPQSKKSAAGGSELTDKAPDDGILAAIMEACQGVEDSAMEQLTDPREPMRRRASIDRRLSLGEVLHTIPAPSSPLRNASPASDYGENVLHTPRDAPEAANDSVDEPRPDPREPMRGRASIDKSISLGKVVPTTPPRHSPIRSASSSAQLSALSGQHLKQQRVSRLTAVSGFAVFCLALAVLSLIVVRSVYLRAHFRFEVCDTEDCVQYARYILATLNKSLDPCVDLYAYVCGDDGRRKDARHASRSPMAHAYVHEVMHTLGNIQTFRAANQRYAAATKAFAAVASCMESNRYTASDDFLAFMQDRGITWPFRAASSRNATLFDVLDIVLDLVVNWRVGLWFDVVVSHTAAHDGTPLVVIGEPGDLVVLRLEQLALFDDVTYHNTVQMVARYLTGGNVSLDDATRKVLLLDEGAFRTIVLPTDQAGDSGDGFDVLVPLGNITQVFGNVLSVADWSILLDKHLSSAIRNVSNDTKLLILNKERFSQLGHLVGLFPVARVLDVVGWTFSYSYVWMVNASFDFPAPAGTAGKLDTSVLCFVAAQESFGIAQAAPVFRDAFSADERWKVMTLLEKTSVAFVEHVVASAAIPNFTKTEAVAKIGSLAWSYWLWPLDPYLQVGSALDVLYANFSETSASVFESWIQSKKALRAALAIPHYERLMTSRYRWQSGSVRYLYTLNELRFSLSALFPPSYVRQGSSAMSFAGLGFKVARQTARSVDMRGRTLDSTGLARSWWQLDKPERQQCRFDVAESATERSLLVDLFAIDLALEAMQVTSVRSQSDMPVRLKLLEWLSDEQTFYVSYCKRYCGEPRGQLACNLAMNGSQFNDAFKCRRKEKTASTCVFL
ncbi:endothelin-converting enzyme 2-like [Dermacentor variabilis]|uniref:endothelin-converting enzyme 2-like n=1 Tax=Dermacentor variabilis TaxID=34621 RepID=UPI003F5C32F8